MCEKCPHPRDRLKQMGKSNVRDRDYIGKENIQMPIENNPREVCEAFESTKLEQDAVIKHYSENK